MHVSCDARQNWQGDIEEVTHSFNAEVARYRAAVKGLSLSPSLQFHNITGYRRNKSMGDGLPLSVEDDYIGNSLDLGELVHHRLDRRHIGIQ